MKGYIRPNPRRYLIIVSLILVLLLQNRFLYLSMIITSVVYLYVYRPSFLNKKVFKRLVFFTMLVILFLSHSLAL